MGTVTAPRPLRMLALIAAPLVHRVGAREVPIPALNAARELEEIADACRLTEAPVAIDIQTEIATTEAINRVFGGAQGGFDILHFSGHGSLANGETALVVEDTSEPGLALLLKPEELRDLIGHSPCLLAVLSACHSEGMAAALLAQGVRHVVAINAEDAVLDTAARVFARRFYQVVLSGQRVREAFSRGVQEVRSDNTLRRLLDEETLEPVTIAEAAKFALLPADDARHEQPLAGVLAPGEVRFRRPPWGERTNLSPVPRDGAAVIGRQRDIYTIGRLLEETRCVAINGFSGMGKTALAEAIGRWQHERARWPDGVVLVNLRNVTRTDEARIQIVAALLTANVVLGNAERASGSDHGLVNELRDRRLLLILDDLDALLRTNADSLYAFIGLLLGTRSMRLLITSQRHLSMARVHHRWVDASRLDPPDALAAFRYYAPITTWHLGREGSERGAATALFGRLLTYLDGYPFAIRLAAAYLTQQGCGLAALVERLGARATDVLRAPNEEARRETSLTAALDLSFQALPSSARAILPTLALFPAGLSRPLARAILGPEGEAALEILHDYAMAERRDDPVGLAGDPTNRQRFALPEPARRYAEHLQSPDALDAVAPSALVAFHTLIARADHLIANGHDLAGRAMLTLEQPNWSLLLDWGYDHEHADGTCHSARATALLSNYWTLTGEKGKSGTAERLDKALACARRLHDVPAEANALRAIGEVQRFRADHAAALGSYEAALGLYRQVGDRLGEANALAAQARLLIDDDPDRSRRLLEDSLGIRRDIDDVYGTGADLGNYGIALLQRGRDQQALEYFERARAIFASRGLSAQVAQVDDLIARVDAAAAPAPDPLVRFEPFVRAVAAVALGNDRNRGAVEAHLPTLEEKGWRLTEPVHRIWAGERDVQSLTAGLDDSDSALVRRILSLIGEADSSRPTDPMVALLARCLTVAQAAARLGVSPARVRQALSKRTLYGFKHGARWRLPAFQFTATGTVPGIERLFLRLDPAEHPIGVENWFILPSSELMVDDAPVSPRDWLLAGRPVEAVVAAVALVDP